jgi:hypothetical protein
VRHRVGRLSGTLAHAHHGDENVDEGCEKDVHAPAYIYRHPVARHHEALVSRESGTWIVDA